MKMNFTAPKMEISRFSEENIVTASKAAEEILRNGEEFKNINDANITRIENTVIDWTY